MNPRQRVRSVRTRPRRLPRPAVLKRVRGLCLALPETSERMSHGQPTFFVGGKTAFVMLMDNHHNDGRLALWCAATPEIQQMLIRSSPERYFMPPYVGYRGWVGCAPRPGSPLDRHCRADRRRLPDRGPVQAHQR